METQRPPPVRPPFSRSGSSLGRRVESGGFQNMVKRLSEFSEAGSEALSDVGETVSEAVSSAKERVVELWQEKVG